MLDAINRERARVGVAPLSPDVRLQEAAQRHSEEMAQRDSLDHVGNGGTSVSDRIHRAGYAWRAVAENIASGSAGADATLVQWLNSPGHYQNLISPLYTQAGIGHAVSARGRDYWTLDLAAPW
jgi:uncharacterized protein YkwD